MNVKNFYPAVAVEDGFMPRIGAQFFTNLNESDESVERHFSMMHDNGIKLVRLFILWAQVEPKSGVWDFSLYDRAYDLAAKYGMQVFSTLTCEDPPAWTKKRPFYHHRVNLNDPKLQELASEYIRQSVTRYADHPAHYCWSLMNEPEVAINYDASTMALFADWLKKKYHTVEEMNRVWYRPHDAFTQVQIDPNDWNNFWTDFASFCDWQNFVEDNLAQQLSWIRDQVAIYDPHSITHAHPKGLLDPVVGTGQACWKEAKVVDTLGVTIHPAWSFNHLPLDEYGIAYAFTIDIIRSAANGKTFWVTELQSGSTILTGKTPFTPTPDQMTAWIWDSVGAGAKAIVYWMWNPREFAQEGGEWGIVSASHHPSARLRASAKASQILEDHADFFKEASPEPARCAILYNHATEILSYIQGAPGFRLKDAPIQASTALYQALCEHQIPVDFVDEEQIINGEIGRYEMLYVPYGYVLDRDVQQGICRFVENGGRLWADVPCAWKDSMGNMYLQAPDLLSDVFGVEIGEYCAAEDTAILCGTENSETCIPTYRYMADILVKDAASLYTYQNTYFEAQPAVTVHSYGNGQAILVGTSASLGYYHTKDAAFSRLIAQPALDLRSNIVRMKNENSRILLRHMIADGKALCIVENWGNECTVEMETDPAYQITDLYGNCPVSAENGHFTLNMKRYQTICLLLTNTNGK